jgi:hypothetical protein
MFKTKTQKTMVALALGVACLAAPSVSRAAQAVKLTGALAGIVKNSNGIPQMGAAVQLYNRQDHMVGRVLTDERGQFKLLGLLPSVYSIRVSLATYVPVIKRDILVQPGMRSMLNVSLSTLFSSIQLSYPTTDGGGIMSDDWKWVLRSSSATRPVLRFLDDSTAGPASPAPGVAGHGGSGGAFLGHARHAEGFGGRRPGSGGSGDGGRSGHGVRAGDFGLRQKPTAGERQFRVRGGFGRSRGRVSHQL